MTKIKHIILLMKEREEKIAPLLRIKKEREEEERRLRLKSIADAMDLFTGTRSQRRKKKIESAAKPIETDVSAEVAR